MTVSEFAVQMYHCDIIKDQVRVIRNGEVLYDDRMEHLRYAHEYFPDKMWFTNETIREVRMTAVDYDYITTILIY